MSDITIAGKGDIVGVQELGPERAALRESQSLLFTTFVGVIAVTSLVLTFARWTEIGGITKAMMLTSGLLALVALWRMWKKNGTPWLLAPVMVLTLLSGFVGTTTSVDRPWIPISVVLTALIYLAATMLPKTTGLIFVILIASLILPLVALDSTYAFYGPALIYNGWLTFIQICSAGIFVWIAWHQERSEADVTDEHFQKYRVTVDQAIESMASHRAWRDAARRVHETVLNTVNYVISTRTVDRDQLTNLMATHARASREKIELSNSREQFSVESMTFNLTSPFHKARYLITAALAGNVIGGLTFLIPLLTDFTYERAACAVVALLAFSIAIVIVIRRNRLEGIEGFGLVLLPAALPWVLILMSPTCSDVRLIGALVNFAGFSIICIAVWTSLRVGIFGIVLWTGGCLAVTAQIPQVCSPFPIVGFFNSAIAIPVALMVVALGTRRFVASQQVFFNTRDQREYELGRARGELQFNREIDGVINDTMKCLSEIASGSEFDDTRRNSLLCLDSRIRVAMQVDKTLDGAMAQLAKSIVDSASIYGVSVKVRDIKSSKNIAPINNQVFELLIDAILKSAGSEPQIGVMNVGDYDILSLRVPQKAAKECGLTVDSVIEIEGVECELEEASARGLHAGEADVIIVVSRRNDSIASG